MNSHRYVLHFDGPTPRDPALFVREKGGAHLYFADKVLKDEAAGIFYLKDEPGTVVKPATHITIYDTDADQSIRDYNSEVCRQVHVLKAEVSDANNRARDNFRSLMEAKDLLAAHEKEKAVLTAERDNLMEVCASRSRGLESLHAEKERRINRLEDELLVRRNALELAKTDLRVDQARLAEWQQAYSDLKIRVANLQKLEAQNGFLRTKVEALEAMVPEGYALNNEDLAMLLHGDTIVNDKGCKLVMVNEDTPWKKVNEVDCD